MNITIENTRWLGTGDTIRSTDYIAMQDDEGQYDFIPVGLEFDGQIIDGTEDYEFRRLIVESPLDLLALEYDIQTEMGRQALLVALENVATLDRKQRDYGSQNITSFAEFGVLVRMNDKMERLKHLNKMPNPKNESIDDSYLDISNYGIIAILLRRGIWK